MAKNFNKPISKLSLFFFFSILIPGCILTYFSIQTIANQKEFTEKRLIEERNELSVHLASIFQQQLLECASKFFNQIDNFSPQFQKLHFIDDSMDCVAQAFVVDSDGQFMWPHYFQGSSFPNQKSEVFLKTFAQAEKLEFAKSDLKSAALSYQQALAKAKNKAERAAALNGLARVLAKRGLQRQAVKQYRKIIEHYDYAVDDTGIPFAYYALHQLLRFSEDEKRKFIEDIEIILNRLISGQIVLTEHTDLLLQEISNRLTHQSFEDTRKAKILLEKISQVRELLSFVNQERNFIMDYASGRYSFVGSQKLGTFDVIANTLNQQPNLLIVQRKESNSIIVGFKTNLEHFKNIMLSAASVKQTSFDIQVKITTSAKAVRIADTPWSTVKELSPLVPSWRICTNPQNPKVIKGYIAQRRWVYGIALTFLVAGMFLGVVLVLRDVSRERRLAQLRSDFVSNVTHELKTPLTSIRMLAETMRLGRIPRKKEQQEYLTIIVNESERLTRLINTVLDFSKIERGQKTYKFVSCNISDAVRSALKAISYTIKEHGFTLKTEIESETVAVADADAIEQAVLNLLSNAIKFSNKVKEINVRLWSEDNLIYLQVEDKGMGISETAQKHVFEKFYRSPTENRITGAGLGLTVVKHIVDAHKGKIEVESQVGTGSKLTIILPKEEN